jgi:hypothetical protein
MRRDLWTTVVPAALAWCFVTAGYSRAQNVSVAIVPQDYDRQLAPGAVVSPRQDPFPIQYGYYYGPQLSVIFGRSYSKDAYIEYIDRVERAEKFGYRIPAPPPGWVPVYTRRPCVVCEPRYVVGPDKLVVTPAVPVTPATPLIPLSH